MSVIRFTNEEMAVMSLSSLYAGYGFKQFKMSKFEEYDLYAENKDFLLGSSVITFTDTNGKLMALKPDVTLSIVKSVGDTRLNTEKVYYSENVYRVDKGTHQYKELMQVGLECIGDIDMYSLSEAVMLAKKSLCEISERNILDISHMGFLNGLLDETKLSEKQRSAVIRYIREKNTIAVEQVCSDNFIGDKVREALVLLTSMYGSFDMKINDLKKVSCSTATDNAVQEMETIYGFLKACGCADGVNIDFSIVSDSGYYNGVVFQGFIDGVPTSVLTGGSYDNLVHKFGKDAGAIGFAVYLDLLERFMGGDKSYDVDVLFVYDCDTKLDDIAKVIDVIKSNGSTVRACASDDGSVKYRQRAEIKNGEVVFYDSND